MEGNSDTTEIQGREQLANSQQAQVPSMGVRENGSKESADDSGILGYRPQYQTTPGTASFAKLTRLVLDVCPDVMRDILRHCLGEGDGNLCQALDENKKVIVEIKGLHNNEERRLYQRRQGISLYSVLDYSLMYKIARNIPKCRKQIDPHDEHGTKWGIEPKINDRSLLASIERLRIARNTFIAHVSGTDITENEFKNKWDKVREPIMDIERHLGWGVRYTEAINSLREASLDPETIRLSMDLLQKEQQIEAMTEEGGKVFQDVDKILNECIELRSKLRSIFNVAADEGQDRQRLTPIKAPNAWTYMFFKPWRQKDKYFYETRGYKAALEVLTNAHQVIISGKPGIGKTGVAVHLLFEFEKQGYNIQFLRNAEDWYNFFNSDMKQIILANDIFGASSIDRKKTKKWISVLPFVHKILQSGDQNSFFVMTTRSYILKSIQQYNKEPFLSKKTEVNLSSDSLKFNEDDKKGILENTICRVRQSGKNLNISEEEKSAIVKSEPPHGFPLCVKWYLSNDKYRSMGINFFNKPLEFVFIMMDSIVNNDINKYFLLLLILLQGEEELPLNVTADSKRLLQSKGLGDISERLDDLNLFKIALELEDLYLIQTSRYSFHFKHESIKDAVGILFGKRNFKEAIGMMKFDTLLDRVRTGEENDEVFETASIVVSSEWDLQEIARRLQAELIQRNVQLVSTYVEWKNVTLVSAFIKQLTSTSDPCETDSQPSPVLYEDKNKGNNLLYWSARQGQNILCKRLIEYLAHFDMPKNHLKYILSLTLESACANKSVVADVTDLDIVAYLVSLEADVSFCQRCFIEEQGNNPKSLPVYIPSKQKEHNSPLEEAARLNMDDVVRYLLSQNARTKHMHWNGWELLHCIARAEDMFICNSEFIKTLMKYDSMMKNENECKRPAFNSSGESIYDIFINITESCHEGMSTDETNALFLLLVQNIPIKKEFIAGILSFGAQLSCTNKMRQSALHLAICSNFTESQVLSAVEVLLNLGCNPNVLDNERISPVILAIKETKHVPIIEKLLHYKADPNLIDKYGLSALHYCIASNELDEKEIKDVVRVLIDGGADITVKDKKGKTPLILAIDMGLKRRFVISEILNTYPRSRDGNLLHYAVNSKLEQSAVREIIDILLQSDITINGRDEMGRTPLMLAVTKSPPNFQLISHLLENGALRKFDDHHKRTVIHHCIGSDNTDDESVETIQLLEKWDDRLRERNKGKDRFRVRSKDKDGLTPIMLCSTVQHDRKKTLEKLLSLGALVNDKDGVGRTALHRIVTSDKSDSEVVAYVNILLKHKAELHIVDKSQKTPLIMAFSSELERHKTIRHLALAQNTKDVGTLVGFGKTYLHVCVESRLSDGQTKDICQIFISKGMDIDINDKNGKHAFEYALSHSDARIETMKFLIENSETLQVRSPKNIMQDLISHGKLFHEIVNTLRECSKVFDSQSLYGIGIFHDIVQQKEPPAELDKLIQSLQKSGFDIDAKDNMENSALLVACRRDSSLSLIKLLLEHGANPKYQNGDGKNALHLCILSERSDKEVCSIVELLLEKGCMIHAKDKIGLSPLNEAIRIPFERIEVIRILLNKGANVVETDRNGYMSLHHCISSDRYDEDACLILEMILERADNNLDIRDSMGNTPLNLAVSFTKYSRVLCILQLLEHNCCTQTVDNFSRSPVYNAIYCLDGHDILIVLERVIRVALLLAYKCDPVTISQDNTTPITIAVRKNYEDVQKLLAEHGLQRKMLPVIKAAIIKVAQHYDAESVSLREIKATKLIDEFKLALQNVSLYLRRAVFSELDYSYVNEWEVASDFVEA